MFKKNNFPVDWTTTQLEGCVPGICDLVGYDVPMDTVFKNKGAPRLVISENQLKIRYSMTAELYKSDD